MVRVLRYTQIMFIEQTDIYIKTIMRKDLIWGFDLATIQDVMDNSSGYKEVCSKLNLPCSKTQIKMIEYRCRVDNINRVKFRENIKNKIKNFNEINLEKILVENSTYYNTNSLKKKLFKYGLLKNEYNNCGISSWCGKEIVCHLDHINGVSNDNRIENLRILCPNCHSQTPTYSNKKMEKNKKLLVVCNMCGKKSDGKIFCKSCQKEISEKVRKVERPPYEQLLEEINELGYVGTGRKYGVSDNAIRKWKKFYENHEK